MGPHTKNVELWGFTQADSDFGKLCSPHEFEEPANICKNEESLTGALRPTDPQSAAYLEYASILKSEQSGSAGPRSRRPSPATFSIIVIGSCDATYDDRMLK